MQEAFGVVIFVVVGLGAVIAVISLFGRSRLYDDIGRGGIEPVRAETPGEDIAELRELLEARNARRVARGEAPIDVEAELSRRLREM